MSLYAKLVECERRGRPIRVGLIGAGKFGSMFLAQIPRTPGMDLVGIADFSPENAITNLKRIGWKAEAYAAKSFEEALKNRNTFITDNWEDLVKRPEIDVIVECTGNPVAAVEHCLESFRFGKHIVNVTVEADAFCGALLHQRAKECGVQYSLAFGDQPALIVDWVDWARGCGFPVVAAGRGHKWLPRFSESTPETVWNDWGLTAEQAEIGGLNPKMFNSFLDGSKPAIESTAVANSCDLQSPEDGLNFPPSSMDDLPNVMRPKSEGGQLASKGVVEVASCLQRDGTPIEHDIRNGVWVVIEGDTDYIRRCFQEYGVRTDESGKYCAIYRRWHLIGLEVGISVASVALRNEPTGTASFFNADVVATAKRDLKPGEMLDGEGGYTVYGNIQPAKKSVKARCLPLGLAHNLKLIKPVAKGQSVCWSDVEADTTLRAYKLRQEMEELFFGTR
ncbi:MAG: NAD(P)H-dependent oxidoreductase [Tropicimonas sp.]|uniref:NAD(P)H-dependent oxidoreductase n=1 Tax=Tropicimonas sp. TaxID=2067044 RepID=UPI003A8C1035